MTYLVSSESTLLGVDVQILAVSIHDHPVACVVCVLISCEDTVSYWIMAHLHGLILLPAKSLHLCLTLCYPVDCSLPDSSVHGIPQARIGEWVAVSSSRGASQEELSLCLLCLLCWQVVSLPLAPPGKALVEGPAVTSE